MSKLVCLSAAFLLISLTGCNVSQENPDNRVQPVERSQATDNQNTANQAPPIEGAPGYGSGPSGPARP